MLHEKSSSFINWVILLCHHCNKYPISSFPGQALIAALLTCLPTSCRAHFSRPLLRDYIYPGLTVQFAHWHLLGPKCRFHKVLNALTSHNWAWRQAPCLKSFVADDSKCHCVGSSPCTVSKVSPPSHLLTTLDRWRVWVRAAGWHGSKGEQGGDRTE